jgi:hypothetical protein
MNVSARAFELARYGGFVLPEQPADFGQCAIVSALMRS